MVLDAPSGAIGETLPDAEQESGPGTRRRAALAIPTSGVCVVAALQDPGTEVLAFRNLFPAKGIGTGQPLRVRA